MLRFLQLCVKRTVDVLGSGIGLLAISPLLMVTGILIKIIMPGPVFFRQQRVGKNRKLFDILKFRSMKVDREAERTLDFSRDAERVTPFGRLIRRLKIDELPQLINVFKGDMSLIGPRPTVKEQVDLYTPRQMHRLDMRPGMTGLAQVNGNTALSWEDRIEYDLEYIKKYSLLLDLKILVKTVLVVICGEEKFKKKKGTAQ